jgi:hypothetical protein
MKRGGRRLGRRAKHSAMSSLRLLEVPKLGRRPRGEVSAEYGREEEGKTLGRRWRERATI